jgi:hypothetical protein
MERLLLALLGSEIERRIAIANRHRKQPRQKLNSLADVIGSPSENGLKFMEPLLVGVVAPESGGALKLGDARI